MIYVDTSVLLAQCLAEDVKPPASLWLQPLVSSRLTEYETFVRINAAGLASSHGEAARELISTLSLLELAPPVVERALEPFPTKVRTLDALHLASISFLRSRHLEVGLASYDRRMLAAAEVSGVPLVDLGSAGLEPRTWKGFKARRSVQEMIDEDRGE